MVNRGTNEQRYAEFVLSGPGGRMLGRDLQWLLGAEQRREAGSLALDPLRAGESPFVFGAVREVRGVYESRELFAGVQVPLLHDRPWARDMALNVGLRWSDFYSFDSRTTWQAGLRWQPAEELTLRTNYAKVFRAPSLAELHEPQFTSEGSEFDPCGNDPTPIQQANCAANGVPGGAYVQDDSGFIVVVGGNPELEPETGHSFGAGLVYTPVWAKGLSASVDYFQQNLTNHISSPAPAELLSECAERGSSSICEAIGRFPDGRVSQVAAHYLNYGESEVRAYDFAINWSAMTRLGDLNTSLLATYLDRWDMQPFPEGAVYSYAGSFDAGARPRWRASGHIDWHSGPWMASYAAEYIGSYSENVGDWPPWDIVFDPLARRVDPVLYHDIEGRFEFDSGVTVRAAITNVTDEDPPYLNIAPANTDVATYRLLGRTYFIELRYRFD
jgi:outer membrane receptor protein involved in Fe transport